MTDPCQGCAVVARRDFLRTAGAMAATTLIALGASPASALAAPIEFVRAASERREEKAYPIPAQDGVQIDRDNDAMITRWQGKVYAYGLACPHQNTALRWHDKDVQFECPKHHSRFTPDGTYVKDSGRATRGLDRYAVRRDGDTILADFDKLYQEDDDEAAWKAAFITV
jgi:Rieske Fe-S protein